MGRTQNNFFYVSTSLYSLAFFILSNLPVLEMIHYSLSSDPIRIFTTTTLRRLRSIDHEDL